MAHSVKLQTPDDMLFAPFGRFMVPPSGIGERQFYSDALAAKSEESALVFHINNVKSATLPITKNTVERHPHAAQCFVPLDVSRYVVMVMPSKADGTPDVTRTLAFLVPGTMGVIFNPGVWHLGATVLDRPGHFAVLMWRGGAEPDDEFYDVPAVTLTENP